MENRKKEKLGSLKYQVTNRLRSMLAIGQSRHEAKKDGSAANKIFSYDSYHTYKKASFRFIDYCKTQHNCKSLDQCRAYVPEWLHLRAETTSASTVKMESSALSKLFGNTNSGVLRDASGRFVNPWGVQTPHRDRDNYTRSRGAKVRDSGFNENRHADLIEFCRAVGPRGGKELPNIKGSDLRFVDGKPYVEIKGKGGRKRFAPIVGSPENVNAIVQSMKRAGDRKIYPHVPSHMDVHSYRSDYAMRIYNSFARSEEELQGKHWFNPSRGKLECAAYRFRVGKLKGIVIDKAAAMQAAEALGHSRIDVFCNNYYRL